MALAVVAAAACGGGDSDSDDAAPPPEATAGEPAASPPATEPSTTEPIDTGVWIGNLDGAPTTVEVDVDPAGIPELEAAEAYRELVGAEPLRYLRVTVNNTSGSTAIPSAYGDINRGDGTDPALVLDFVCAYVRTFWSIAPDVSSEDAQAAFEAQQAASEALECSGPRTAEPGEIATYWLAATEDQPEIDHLSIRFNDFVHEG